jgi:uncharacterized protein YqhQ
MAEEHANTVSKSPEKQKAGGQAVIEGVMMRSPRSTAVAVRRPDGSILARKLHLEQLTDRSEIWKKPVFRGAAMLIDTLRLGMRALNWSAEVAEGKGESDKKESSGFSAFASTAFAFILAVALFAWLPLQGSKWILETGSAAATGHQFGIHLLAGLFRIAAFLIYICLISLLPDVKRLFMYHGAEHQTIHAWEKNLEPLAERAVEQSPLHQRCGTSFLLLVMLGTVIFYGIFDSLVVLVTRTNPSAMVRILYHLPLIPLVMGLSYEVLKIADKHLETSRIARIVTAPGLFLQKLTTRKAGLPEIEVAVVSLKLSLDIDPGPEVDIEEAETG